jgi:hypothetical protein
MISTTTTVTTEDFENQTGWQIKPEGACWGDRCVPLSEPMSDSIDLNTISKQLTMPLVHDEDAGVWALGPESGGTALMNAQAPDVALPDWQDKAFRLRSLRGKKVLLIAWASW